MSDLRRVESNTHEAEVFCSQKYSLSSRPRIAVISNRNSGHNRDRFDRISMLMNDSENIENHPTDAVEELPKKLRELAANAPDVLVINGGDGTAASVFAQLLENRPFETTPLIALLPGGTANMTASDVGIKGSLVRATERLCNWSKGINVSNYELTERYVLRVQAGNTDAAHYGMFFGAGAIIQGTEYAHRKIHSRGLRDDFSVGLGALRTVWGLVRGDEEFDHPLPVGIRWGDREDYQWHDLRILAVSTLARLFMGFHPFWGNGEGALKMSFITRDARHLLLRFPGVLRGKPGKHTEENSGYYSFNTSRLELLMDGSFNLDGEIIAARRENGPVKITAAGPLTFLKLL